MLRIVGYIGGGNIQHRIDDDTIEPAKILFRTDKMEESLLVSGIVSLEVNKADSFEFTISRSLDEEDEITSKIQPYRNWILIEEQLIDDANYTEDLTAEVLDSQILFFGRPSIVDVDLYGNRTVTCEGVLAFLNDAIARPKDMSSDTIKHFLSDAMDFYTDSITPSDDQFDGIKSGIDFAYKEIGFNAFTSSDGPINTELSNSANDDTILNLISSYVVQEQGGFFTLSYAIDREKSDEDSTFYDRFNTITSMMTYEAFNESKKFGVGIGGDNPLVLYPNEEEERDFRRYTWLPYFAVGNNIVNLSREAAMETFFTGVYPVGKDNLTLNNSDFSKRYVWNDEMVKKYGRIAIALSYKDVTSTSTLRSYANQWLKQHTEDGLLSEYKYTITGPEPAVIGCGDVLIRPMHDVMFLSNPEKELEYGESYPCLSMTIDLFNPQNNQYTFGPFVSDNYADTSISESISQSKKKKKKK